MPTSGAAVSPAVPGTAIPAPFRNSSMRTSCSFEAGKRGGQPALAKQSVLQSNCSGTALLGPSSGASAPVRTFGLWSGQSGKSDSAVGRARRRAGIPVSVGAGREEMTGDIAHLVSPPIFRLLFAWSSTFVFYSPHCEMGREPGETLRRVPLKTPFWENCNRERHDRLAILRLASRPTLLGKPATLRSYTGTSGRPLQAVALQPSPLHSAASTVENLPA